MTMFNKDQIFQLLESRDGEALRALWQGRGAVDIAALLDSVEDGARQAAVFRTLPKDLAADVFSYLPGPTQATLARSFADGELQQIFDALHLDDAADFLEELPANLVTRILRSASPQRRMAVNALLRYPADSAGSVMTPEFVSSGRAIRSGRRWIPSAAPESTRRRSTPAMCWSTGSCWAWCRPRTC